jgi:hypothetical protein
MNTIELIKNSVVAVSANACPVRLSASIEIHRRSAKERNQGEGLGILCGEWIFTCAHYRDSFATKPGEADLFVAWCANMARIPRGVFASLYASSMDFQVLAPDGMTVETSEAGGTESSLQMIGEFHERFGKGIWPAEVVFEKGAASATLAGFFFGPDGRTIHRAKFKLWPGSGKIEFFSNDFVKGCSGGPIFTNGNQLIGVGTVHSNHPFPNGLRQCWGNRIDQCMPRLLQARIEWGRLLIKPQPEAAASQAVDAADG